MEISEFASLKTVQTEQFLLIYNFENHLNLQFLLLLIYSTPSVIRRSMPSSCCRISCQSDEVVVALTVDIHRIFDILGPRPTTLS